MRYNVVRKMAIPRIVFRLSRKLGAALLVLALHIPPAIAQDPLEPPIPSSKKILKALDIFERAGGGILDREGGGLLGGPDSPEGRLPASAENHPVPAPTYLPQAMAIIEQTSRNSAKSLGKPDLSFSGRLKRVLRKYSPDPRLTFKVERGGRVFPIRNGENGKAGISYDANDTAPEVGTFYDREGRLRSWVRDPAAPGGVRVLESPPMEALRKLTKGFIDWGFEQDYVGIDAGALPVVSQKPVKDQTYLERKNAKKRFVTRMGLSLNMPHPIEVGKQYYLRGKVVGKGASLVKVSRWVDGSFAGDEGVTGKSFSIPLKFSKSGMHSLKVETLDTEGNKRTRFIQFPVAFTMSVKSITSKSGRLALQIRIAGSDGPYKAIFTTSDGQKFEAKTSESGGRFNDVTTTIFDGANILQRIPNPGQDTVKWVDIVVEDIAAGYVVSRRVKLDDVPVTARFSAAKTDLATDEKTTLVVDITGGEPLFTMFLYENGEKTQVRAAKGRKGNFIVSFDEPGTYRMTVDIVSKNIAGEKKTITTRPLVLTVSAPEDIVPPAEKTVSVLNGAVDTFKVSKSGYKWLGLPGWMKGTVAISISGSTVSAKISYEANDLIYTDYTGVASGVISGYLTRQGKLVLAGRIPYQANDLPGCERTNNSGDQRTCQGTVVVWIKGQRVGNRLEGNWNFDRKHEGRWQSATIDEVFLTPGEVEVFDKSAAEAVEIFKVNVANSNEYDLFKDALLAYFE